MRMLFRREWGTGQPVIVMHPLGLESSAFEGFGSVLGRRGMRTIAVDLPGFGQTPLPHVPITPAVMAEPVIALARSLEAPPVVLGVSMGGRVALEAALTAPEIFRAVIAIAPSLPWLRYRLLLEPARLLDPRMAHWIPLERVWPALRWLAYALETLPALRDDELAQAGARLVYNFACPATRASFISASRGLALDPAYGPEGLWTRLPGRLPPAAFVWGERDQLVSLRFARAVARIRPDLTQLLLPCAGHWLNGPHHRCLADAVAALVTNLVQAEPVGVPVAHPSGVAFVQGPCRAASLSCAAAPILAETKNGA
jgi:pimeloyl-ACP methyl ester carboxylesterase